MGMPARDHALEQGPDGGTMAVGPRGGAGRPDRPTGDRPAQEIAPPLRAGNILHDAIAGTLAAVDGGLERRSVGKVVADGDTGLAVSESADRPGVPVPPTRGRATRGRRGRRPVPERFGRHGPLVPEEPQEAVEGFRKVLLGLMEPDARRRFTAIDK